AEASVLAELEEEEDEDEEEEDVEEVEKEKDDLEEEEELPGTPPEPEEAEELQLYTHPIARTGLLYDERMEEHYNPWDSQHPEAPQRIRRVMERLQELGLAQQCLRIPAWPARREQLRACHTHQLVALLSGSAGLRLRELRALAGRFSSLFLCPRSYHCARLAAGTACAAAAAVWHGKVRLSRIR
ncbi:HDAC6 deacetylase, partial [Rhinopomastus cyanomelas]|nr:HDAC6 deacetylase [Rhinopomastus cyanomelas]